MTDLRWYPRAMAANVAGDAAGTDPRLCQQVAAVLRTLLARSLAQVAAGLPLNEDEQMLISSWVSDLAHLADPEARPMIEAAFDADLVDDFVIGRDTVEDMYRLSGGGVPATRLTGWCAIVSPIAHIWPP